MGGTEHNASIFATVETRLTKASRQTNKKNEFQGGGVVILIRVEINHVKPQVKLYTRDVQALADADREEDAIRLNVLARDR